MLARMRARFIGGAKDKAVITPWPDPPPAYWGDDDGDYELFAIIRDGEEALYKVMEGEKRDPPDSMVSGTEAEPVRRGWRWKPRRNRPARLAPRPARADRKLPRPAPDR
jgi:hypothetical protein